MLLRWSGSTLQREEEKDGGKGQVGGGGVPSCVSTFSEYVFPCQLS